MLGPVGGRLVASDHLRSPHALRQRQPPLQRIDARMDLVHPLSEARHAAHLVECVGEVLHCARECAKKRGVAHELGGDLCTRRVVCVQRVCVRASARVCVCVRVCVRLRTRV